MDTTLTCNEKGSGGSVAIFWHTCASGSIPHNLTLGKSDGITSTLTFPYDATTEKVVVAVSNLMGSLSHWVTGLDKGFQTSTTKKSESVVKSHWLMFSKGQNTRLESAISSSG